MFFQESIAAKRRTLQIRQTTNINLKSRNIKRILNKLRASIDYKFKEKPGVTIVVKMFKFTVLTLFGTLLACPWATSSADIIESCSICSSGNFNDIGKCILRKKCVFQSFRRPLFVPKNFLGNILSTFCQELDSSGCCGTRRRRAWPR